MASIRKRGNSYLLVVSMGYDPEGHRLKPQQKTVHPPENLTPKAKEKWLEEEAALFEWQCRNEPLPVDKSITLAAYTAYWLATSAPPEIIRLAAVCRRLWTFKSRGRPCFLRINLNRQVKVLGVIGKSAPWRRKI
jgi:hypothetical protein